MAKANKISTTAMSTNRAKVCIYLLSPLALDLPSTKLSRSRAWRKGQSIELNRVEHPNDRLLIVTFVDSEI